MSTCFVVIPLEKTTLSNFLSLHKKLTLNTKITNNYEVTTISQHQIIQIQIPCYGHT